jgi:penicillin-insensitive murein endopeptidase
MRTLPTIAILLLLAGCAGSERAESARVELARPATAAAADIVEPTAVEVAAEEVATDEPESPEDPTVPEASDAPAVDPVAALLALDGSGSTSIGGPNNGRLEGGVPLPDGAPGLFSNANRPNPAAFYGTVETIQALVRAAAVVKEQFGEAELVINDIGFEAGGPIARHSSHQAGRDVDALFYYLDRQGNPLHSKGVPVDLQGWGWDFGDLADAADDVRMRLDVRRTWRFVQALLEDETVSVNRIFVGEHIRTMLLAEAERVRAPARVKQLFEHVTCQPGSPHDDHLHIRFFCAVEDIRAGCQDALPFYWWQRQAVRAEGVDLVREERNRDHDRAVRSRVVSRREAEERAERETRAAFHPRVRRFLEEREVWTQQPHPGRPYCR